MLIPSKRQAFKESADEVGANRIMLGMHFPHDINGGKELAYLVVGALLQNPVFLADFELAKQELAKKYFVEDDNY